MEALLIINPTPFVHEKSTFTLYIRLFIHSDLCANGPTETHGVYLCEPKPLSHARQHQSNRTKKGWDIQGFQVGGKTLRYFSEPHSKQLTDRKPKFAIYPQTQHLNDYVLIRLREKRNHRLMPAPEFKDCDYTRIELNRFKIENLPNMGFAVTPLKELFPGEYILVDITQKKTNAYGDFKAYDFTVEE